MYPLHKKTALCWIFDQLTLEGTNISHPKKRKVIFESTCVVDMLLSWRVLYIINPFILSKTKPRYNKFFVDWILKPSPCGEFPFQRRFPEIRCGPVTQTQYQAVIGRGEGPLPAKAATQNLQGTTKVSHCWVSPVKCNNDKSTPRKNAAICCFHI